MQVKSIKIPQRVQPNELDALLRSSVSFGKTPVVQDDTPIMIDAMASIQNGKLMFITSVKIGTLVGLLETEDARLSLEQRRQRRPDLSRIPNMAEYLRGDPWAYAAITAALSGSFEFHPLNPASGERTRMGRLRIPRGYKARSVIIDGQHRFLSLRAALGLEPRFNRYELVEDKRKTLAEENIGVIFYVFADDSEGVRWSQQYFHDLNCLGVATSRSLGIKFDRRHPLNRLTVHIADRAQPFVGRIELEHHSCGPSNHNLFTLSALKNANRALLGSVSDDDYTAKFDQALEFWNEVAKVFPEWTEMPGNKVRDEFIHGYGVALDAIGLAGNALLERTTSDMASCLTRLRSLDWNRWHRGKDGKCSLTPEGGRQANTFWNGIGMVGSKVQNTSANVRNMSLLLKKTMGLELSDKDEMELRFARASE
jgi:DNA sulfur modification protein DndB